MAKFAVLKADDTRDMYDADFQKSERVPDGNLRIAQRSSDETVKVYAAGWWREIQF